MRIRGRSLFLPQAALAGLTGGLVWRGSCRSDACG